MIVFISAQLPTPRMRRSQRMKQVGRTADDWAIEKTEAARKNYCKALLLFKKTVFYEILCNCFIEEPLSYVIFFNCSWIIVINVKLCIVKIIIKNCGANLSYAAKHKSGVMLLKYVAWVLQCCGRTYMDNSLAWKIDIETRAARRAAKH